MSVSQKVRHGAMAAGAFGALALGGSALANAASDNSTTSQGGAAQSAPYEAPERPDVRIHGADEEPVAAARKIRAALEDAWV